MEQLGTQWTGFHEIRYFIIFRKSVEKIQMSLKSDRITGTLLEADRYSFLSVSRLILLRIRNVSNRLVDKSKTHFVFATFFENLFLFLDNL